MSNSAHEAILTQVQDRLAILNIRWCPITKAIGTILESSRRGWRYNNMYELNSVDENHNRLLTGVCENYILKTQIVPNISMP
jgi:hypothetical protein